MGVLGVIGASGLIGLAYFFYKLVASIYVFLTLSIKHKKYYVKILDQKDFRIVFGKNNKITGRVYYYNAELEDENKTITLYTEKIPENCTTKLKENDRILIFYNSKHNYTIDYTQKIKNIKKSLLSFLIAAGIFSVWLAIVLLLIYLGNN